MVVPTNCLPNIDSLEAALKRDLMFDVGVPDLLIMTVVQMSGEAYRAERGRQPPGARFDYALRVQVRMLPVAC